jgi:prephenate dehydrogenase
VEFSGPSAAIKGLYEGKTNIICEVERTAFKLQESIGTFKAMGMRIRYMDPKRMTNILYMSLTYLTLVLLCW